ncbi:hypothetical protein H3H39_26360 [Duganella sp. LX47W]|uniref:Uncharacterized protein n=2 Tax=Rugamonas apoptosis TaxID=2758570 RepID=A0A7W2FFC9_9BURK|nr:hypothetical protein [Rugamonas apoptosis]
MTKTDVLVFGFFFFGSLKNSTTSLYFACFQRGCSQKNADQIVISDALDQHSQIGRVAYIVDPILAPGSEDLELEKLCRIAVAQFLGQGVFESRLPYPIPLAFSSEPWRGGIQLV